MKFFNMRNLLILLFVFSLSGLQANSNPCDEPVESGYHVVQAGETLYRIAKQYRVSVTELQRWNALSSDIIQPCQKIRIAGTTLAQAAPTPMPESQARSAPAVQPAWTTTNGQHIVQPGESLAGLAATYGYTESRFRYMNKLGADEPIRAGQALITTDCFVAQGSTTVVTGSMLSAYADAVQASITPTDTPEMALADTPELTPRSGDSTPPVRRNIHVVAPNEQLMDIARKHNLSINQLRELNNMEPGETVLPGQRIIVQ